MDFIYGIRMKDLRHKYFGDIIPANRIDMPAPNKNGTEDELIKEMLENDRKQNEQQTRIV